MACPSKTSNVTTATAVKAIRGTVWTVLCYSTADAGTVTIKDGGAGGTTIATITVPAGADPFAMPFLVGLKCSTSIYVDVSNCTALVHYS